MVANITLMRPRGFLLALSLTLLAPAGPPATAAPIPDGGPYRVQMLYRTGSSLAPFRVTIQASSDNDLGMWFAIELYKPKGRWIKRTGMGFGGYFAIAATPFPKAYGDDPVTGAIPTCPGLPGCTWPVPFDGSRAFIAEPTATSRYYFVTAHANVKVIADSTQWRLKDVPNPGFRRVFANRSHATGASSQAIVAERFTSATAPGGRYGSAVYAYVPCETTGWGTARLTARGATTDNIGFDPPHDLVCSPEYQDPGEYAYTPYHTTWRLEGDVVGVGSGDTRLVVFDFPKP